MKKIIAIILIVIISLFNIVFADPVPGGDPTLKISKPPIEVEVNVPLSK